MKLSAFINFLIVSCVVSTSSLYAATDKVPDVTIEGLQLIKDSDLTLVYAEPGVDLSQYSKVILGDVFVAFRKHWRRDQNRNHPHKISTDDMAKMKAELSSLFLVVFSKTLQEGGYELVNERADDVLLIKPAIINLDVIAPDNMSANDTLAYSETSGEMTLYLELYDSLSDDMIAKALDRKIDRQTGYFQWQTQISNRAAANRILQVWANVLKEGLDVARGVASQ